jgi:hypothetical protein
MSDMSFRLTKFNNGNQTTPISRVINVMADYTQHKRRFLNRLKTKLNNYQYSS